MNDKLTGKDHNHLSMVYLYFIINHSKRLLILIVKFGFAIVLIQ